MAKSGFGRRFHDFDLNYYKLEVNIQKCVEKHQFYVVLSRFQLMKN